MTNNNLQDSLIDSLKRSKDDYNNVTMSHTHFLVAFAKRMYTITRNILNAHHVYLRFTLNAMVPL